MKKTVQLILVCLLLLYPATKVFCQNKGIDSLTIKQTCLSATVTAIQLEIKRYQGWIDYAKQQNDTSKVAGYQITLDSLKKDLNKYRQMRAEEYVIPKKQEINHAPFDNSFSPQLITTTAWVEETAADNTVLYVEGMSKSGPWFHLAGIVGNDYSKLKPNEKYKITFYTVYGRNYWNMANAYVCIVSVKK